MNINSTVYRYLLRIIAILLTILITASFVMSIHKQRSELVNKNRISTIKSDLIKKLQSQNSINLDVSQLRETNFTIIEACKSVNNVPSKKRIDDQWMMRYWPQTHFEFEYGNALTIFGETVADDIKHLVDVDMRVTDLCAPPASYEGDWKQAVWKLQSDMTRAILFDRIQLSVLDNAYTYNKLGDIDSDDILFPENN